MSESNSDSYLASNEGKTLKKNQKKFNQLRAKTTKRKRKIKKLKNQK